MTIGKHTLTVYNIYSEGLPPFNNVEGYNKTVIKFGQWEDTTDRQANSNGITQINQLISVIIPKTAKTGGKKYVSPMEWESLTPAQKLITWTLKVGRDYIVFGESPEITTSYPFATMQKDYRCCLISAAEDLTNQPIMPHFEVLGI
jgi:hypothetical protein